MIETEMRTHLWEKKHMATHAAAIEKIRNSKLEQVVTTNSIPLSEAGEKCTKIKVLSVAALLAHAIRSIHEETSVSRLFI